MGLARVRDQDGYTVVELLVVLLILGFVMAAVMGTGTSAQRYSVREAERAQSVIDAQTAVYRMTRELRQATLIMPTGTGVGQCAATATASCIDFVVRTRDMAATGTAGYTDSRDRNNHLMQRVRIDCTRPYAGPAGTGTDAYRSCERFVSPVVVDTVLQTAGPRTLPPAPATTSTGIVVPAVINWTTGTCAAMSPPLCPIFSYRFSNNAAALPSTDTTPSNAQQVNVTLQVPAAGEGRSLGAKHTTLVQDGAQLRNGTS